jgi:molybdenum cofactor cytidylyltransferase
MTARPPRVAGIILAAGTSSRFGHGNKLLLEIDGAAMVARVGEIALAGRLDPVIAVTGYDADHVAAALRPLRIDIVHNPRFRDGQSSSLRAGLAALPAGVDGAVILLGDMPRVDPSVIEELRAGFAANGRKSICVPVMAGRRGNPILWGSFYFREMMTLSGDNGAKSLLTTHAERVVAVEVATDTIFTDFDTEADFARA